LLRCHEPYEKPYNDALGYGFLAYMGLFSIITVVLKVNAAQESCPMKKGLLLDSIPWPGLTFGIPAFALIPCSEFSPLHSLSRFYERF